MGDEVIEEEIRKGEEERERERAHDIAILKEETELIKSQECYYKYCCIYIPPLLYLVIYIYIPCSI
jgi:hypothetical protein